MSRRRRKVGPAGIVLVDKPLGPSSAELVDWIRWSLRGAPVGHCGTLDPMASGLLVCCVGEATKLCHYLTPADKTYVAQFVLGRSTTTADAVGETLESTEVPDGALGQAAVALEGMVGSLMLSPPSFSAVKVDGKRAYELAREGEDFELPAREMTLQSVRELQLVAPGTLTAKLRVTKGTFIRSIAVELGRRVGLPCHLGGLRRTACGALSLDTDASLAGFDVTPIDPTPAGKPRHRVRLCGSELTREGQESAILRALLSPMTGHGLPEVEIGSDDASHEALRRLTNGQSIAWPHELPASPFALVCHSRRALIVACLDDRVPGAHIRPQRVVLAPSDEQRSLDIGAAGEDSPPTLKN